MSLDLDNQLLLWIAEEIEGDTSHAVSVPSTPVSIKLLMMRLAVVSRANDPGLTKSTEISLQAFERASLFRIMRQFERRELVKFVDSKGADLSKEEAQKMNLPDAPDRTLGFVAITQRGLAEVQRLNLKTQSDSPEKGTTVTR